MPATESSWTPPFCAVAKGGVADFRGVPESGCEFAWASLPNGEESQCVLLECLEFGTRGCHGHLKSVLQP